MSFFVTFESKQEAFKGLLQTHFNRPLRLRGEWEVGIAMLYMPLTASPIWAFSNIVEFTYVNEVPMQLLGVLDSNDHKIKKPLYFKVCKKTISNINMDFKQDPKSDNFTLETPIVCILHFRKA